MPTHNPSPEDKKPSKSESEPPFAEREQSPDPLPIIPAGMEAVVDKAGEVIAQLLQKQNEDKENERKHQLALFREQAAAEDKKNLREAKHRWGIIGAGVLVILIGGAYLLFKAEGSTNTMGKDLIVLAVVGIFAFWAGGNKGGKSDPPQSDD